MLALQEVWRPDHDTSVPEEVAEELGYEIHEMWTGRAVVEPTCRTVGHTGDPVGTGDWGQALLTRVPRGPVIEHRLDGFLFDPNDRAVMTTDIELDGASLTVCASHFPHLEHISPLLRWRLRGVLPETHHPAVLMGDFNMWRWVARFIVPGWRDTVRGPTWPSRQRNRCRGRSRWRVGPPADPSPRLGQTTVSWALGPLHRLDVEVDR